MIPLFQYSLAVSVPMFVLWVLYRCSLSSEPRFKANRVFIWLIYATALLLMPLIVWYHSRFGGNLFGAPVVINLISADVLSYVRIVAALWVAGAAMVVIMTVADVVRICLILKRCKRIDAGDYVLHVSDCALSPFSFGRHIVLSGRDYDDEAAIIIAHERGHIRYRHSFDMVLAQIVAILCWYNPAAWLMRSELRSVHEYQADSFALTDGVELRTYQSFLLKKALGSKFPWIASRFNHSKVMGRIAMMNRPRNAGSWSLVRYVVPVIGIVACAVVLDNPQVRAPIMAYAVETRQQIHSSGLPSDISLFVDGERLDPADLNQIPTDEIKSITVNKKDNRIDIFMTE